MISLKTVSSYHGIKILCLTTIVTLYTCANCCRSSWIQVFWKSMKWWSCLCLRNKNEETTNKSSVDNKNLNNTINKKIRFSIAQNKRKKLRVKKHEWLGKVDSDFVCHNWNAESIVNPHSNKSFWNVKYYTVRSGCFTFF